MTEGGNEASSPPALHRSVSTTMLALYGIGTMVGAGIYALIGEVAGASGVLAPAAFLVAALIAGLTAFSFAELSSRYPQSAGEAAYISAAFDKRAISTIVGLLIVASGIVSSGVMFRGFAGYAAELIAFEPWLAFLLLAVVIGGIAAWGIAQSIWTIALITLVETGAVLLVIALGLFSAPATELPQASADPTAMSAVIAGAILAFYAFIGFEDMVNIAEEVRNPRKSLPRAILVAMLLTAIIYVLLAFVAVRAMAPAELAASGAPMTLLLSRVSELPTGWMNYVAIIAVLNGALVQIVMASRVLYGLSRQGLLPGGLGHVNARTKTPVRATMLVAAAVFVGAALLPLVVLAKFTSLFLLVIFALVNAALIRIKSFPVDSPIDDANEAQAHFSAPPLVPWLGMISAALLAAANLYQLVAT